MTMDLRKLAFSFLAVLACSRSPEDAGIVLNVDTDVTADRAVIDHLIVTIDSKQQDWVLTRPLPGSLGIETSPGNKSVIVEGFTKTALRGHWSATIAVDKGKVVVQDVHLAPVDGPPLDAGARIDDAARDVIDAGAVRDGAGDAGPGLDLGGRDVVGIDEAGNIAGKDVSSGKDTTTVFLDGSPGDTAEAGDISSRDTGMDRGDAATSEEVLGLDGATSSDDVPSITRERFAGDLSVSSEFQVPAPAAATGRLADTLGLVHSLVVNPGAAILQFADEAGVPEAATLRAVLPDALESKLADWMNAYLKAANVNGVVPYDRLVWLDDTVRSLLLNWELRSTLALPVGEAETHTPISLVFLSPTGPIPLDPTDQITPGVGIIATLAWPNGPSGAAVMSISDHTMGLPFGRYALQALDGILLAEYGTENVAAYLTSSVDCSAMAASVASRCISIVCVGHTTELVAICQGGLSEGAKQIENQIRGLDFKAIHFQSGTATAVGSTVSLPNNGTSLTDGVWAATIDFGDGPQPATATFTASTE
jgi:hypothetical protein